MAHRVISLPRGNSVAFGLKRTSGRVLWVRPRLANHPSWNGLCLV